MTEAAEVAIDEPAEDPSDTEIVNTVKLWGLASGVAHDQLDERVHRPGWCLSFLASAPGIWHNNAAGEASLSVHPDADALLVWALAVISGRSEDVGKCSTCKGSGTEGKVFGFNDREAAEELEAANRSTGWTTTLAPIKDVECDWVLTITRPCASCGGRKVPHAGQVSSVRIKKHSEGDVVGVSVDGVVNYAAADFNAPASTSALLVSQLRTSAYVSDRADVESAADPVSWIGGVVLRFRDDEPHEVVPVGHAVEVTTVTEPTPAMELPGSGRDVREAARLVLDAAPRSGTNGSMFQRSLAESTAREHIENLRPGSTYEVIESPVHDAPPGHKLWAYRWTEPGDPAAIATILVSMERWDVGDPLGPAVANWLREIDLGERLAGWRREALAGVRAAWERLTVPCERCEGTGEWHFRHHDGTYSCEACNGDGRVKPRPASEWEASDREDSERWRALVEDARQATLDPAVRAATNRQLRGAETFTDRDLLPLDDRAHALLGKVLRASPGLHRLTTTGWVLAAPPTRDDLDGPLSFTFTWTDGDSELTARFTLAGAHSAVLVSVGLEPQQRLPSVEAGLA